MSGCKLTAAALQKRYGVCWRTIDRWAKAGVLPQPMRINRIRFWDEGEVEQYDQRREAQVYGGQVRKEEKTREVRRPS